MMRFQRFASFPGRHFRRYQRLAVEPSVQTLAMELLISASTAVLVVETARLTPGPGSRDINTYTIAALVE
jgi:hypothetical protein